MSDTPILRRFLPHYVSEDIRGVTVQPWRNNQLKYVQQQKQNSKESFCCIDIPITLLLCWETIKKKSADFKSFVRLLNERIPGGGFAIKDTAGRIEERLRVKCALISNQFKTASGRKKKDLLSGSYRMNIFLEEVLSVDMLHAELERETKIIKNLEKENQKIYEELIEEIKQKKIREDQMLTETVSLKKYIEKLEKKIGTDKNAKELSTLSPTTKWRYLKDLKTRAQKALWFLRAYGLKLNSLEVEETNSTCTTHNFNLGDPSSTAPTNTGSTSKYSTLTEDDKKKVEEVLFLMDRFSVSEEFYHQLTMVCDGLPRSYLVKQCKNHLNELSHLTVTPGKSQGVQTSFKELLKEQIIDLVSYITFIC